MTTVVIKIGTSSLSNPVTGDLRLATLGGLAETITRLRRGGVRVVLVSSGAIGVGCARLGLKERPTTVSGKQAAAAVGQGLLMSLYDQFFSALRQPIAQVLLTRQDLIDRTRYLNIRETLQELLRWETVPIVNENDTVATEELRFGDNDALSALVAGLVEADWLILLTDVPGLYSANPHLDPEAQLVSEVSEITDALVQSARSKGSAWSTGGMASKLEAARIAAAAGVTTVITEGSTPHNIERILAGEQIGTRFKPTVQTRTPNRKRWIAFGLVPAGTLHLDEGAVRAVRTEGRSLLAAGVTRFEGCFEAQALVRLLDSQGVEFARGLIHYSSEELEKIRGRQTAEISRILGIEERAPTVVHRNDLIILS